MNDKGVPVNLKTSTCMFTYTIWLNKEKSAVREKSLGSKKIVGNRRETHGGQRIKDLGAKKKIGPPKNKIGDTGKKLGGRRNFSGNTRHFL